MTTSTLHKSLRKNITLKILSLIFGFIIWCMLSEYQTITLEQTIPVCFYGASNDLIVSANEDIVVTLSGKRTNIYWFDKKALALHVDVHTLHMGHNIVSITPASLFLPETIKLIDYSPSAIAVTVEKKSETNQQETDLPLHEQ